MPRQLAEASQPRGAPLTRHIFVMAVSLVSPSFPLPGGAPTDGKVPGALAMARARVQALDDAALLAHMRADAPDPDGLRDLAYAEFLLRFEGPVREAVRARVPPHLLDECVLDVLADEAFRLTETGVVPRNLAGYLVRAVRHRALRHRRSAERRDRWHREAALDEGAASPAPWTGAGRPRVVSEGVVASLCSAYTRTASRGVEHGSDPSETEHAADDALVASALATLVDRLAREVDERQLRVLVWRSEGVTQREIAARLGVTVRAVEQRAARWRARAPALLARLLNDPAFSPEERAALRRRYATDPADTIAATDAVSPRGTACRRPSAGASDP